MLIVEAPVRFDLRIKEYRHLKLFVPEGASQPKQAKKGFTMKDIASEWKVHYKTVQRNRQKLLPFPDGRWNSSLIWKKIPENPFTTPKVVEI
jgi:hypothetical protein